MWNCWGGLVTPCSIKMKQTNNGFIFLVANHMLYYWCFGRGKYDAKEFFFESVYCPTICWNTIGAVLEQHHWRWHASALSAPSVKANNIYFHYFERAMACTHPKLFRAIVGFQSTLDWTSFFRHCSLRMCIKWTHVYWGCILYGCIAVFSFWEPRSVIMEKGSTVLSHDVSQLHFFDVWRFAEYIWGKSVWQWLLIIFKNTWCANSSREFGIQPLILVKI